MRLVALALLILPAAAWPADGADPFISLARQFEEARKKTSTPGGRAQVLPIVERLAASGDARAIDLLAPYLVETYAREAEAFRLMKASQQRGARAHESIGEIDREIEHLQRKQRAGDNSVGPRIRKLTQQRRQANDIFDKAKLQTDRFGRLVDFLRDLREALAENMARLLKGLEGADLERGFGSLRAALDAADHEQGLFLVRILSESGKPQAEQHLLDVMAHPKLGRPVLLAAIPAVARLKTRNSCVALMRLARRDESLRAYVLHALGLAAGQRLADLAKAQAWVDTLP